MKKQQATIDNLVATADRVVAYRYDRPIEKPAVPSEDNRLPSFMLMDQSPNLDAESDTEFLRSVGVE